MIVARAPVRVCDLGGWTDTWFGGPGRVLHLAVGPPVEASITPASIASAPPADGRPPVLLSVGDFGDRYPVEPGRSRRPRQPLLEAAIDALPPPAGKPVEISVTSAVPPGCGTGTSAAVAVALLAALAAHRGEELTPAAAARTAHRLEVEVLGGESGVQDQLAAAFGGINYLEIDHYPEAAVTRLPQWDQLDDLLTVVYLGRPHHSSHIHRQVIDTLAKGDSTVLPRLRAAASAGRDAVLARDLEALGRAMVDNTESQAALHPALVGGDARTVMEVAAAQGALGWKVNGAGGDGGSVTVLSSTPERQRELATAIAGVGRPFEVLPLGLSPSGLQVSCSP